MVTSVFKRFMLLDYPGFLTKEVVAKLKIQYELLPVKS